MGSLGGFCLCFLLVFSHNVLSACAFQPCHDFTSFEMPCQTKCHNAVSFRRRNRPFSLDDLAIRFGAAIAGEVEQSLLIVGAHVQIYACSDQLVSVGDCLGNDLPGWGDDAAVGQQLAAFFRAAFGSPDHPHAVLIRARLHHEMIVESLQRVLRGIGRIVERGVVADQHQLCAVQPHDPISLRPAAVVADGHAHDAAECPPDLETFLAFFKVSPL